jgi:hypothetical protein
MTVAAVVFDLDGLLIDSEQVWDEVREQLAAERGGRWHPDAQRDMMGMSSPEGPGEAYPASPQWSPTTIDDDMGAVDESLPDLPRPWSIIRDETETRESWTRELQIECGPSHPLRGRPAEAWARCGACDKAVFRLLDRDEWVLVHLTWRGSEESDPKWPTLHALGPRPAVMNAAHQHAAEHGG